MGILLLSKSQPLPNLVLEVKWRSFWLTTLVALCYVNGMSVRCKNPDTLRRDTLSLLESEAFAACMFTRNTPCGGRRVTRAMPIMWRSFWLTPLIALGYLNGMSVPSENPYHFAKGYSFLGRK